MDFIDRELNRKYKYGHDISVDLFPFWLEYVKIDVGEKETMVFKILRSFAIIVINGCLTVNTKKEFYNLILCSAITTGDTGKQVRNVSFIA